MTYSMLLAKECW